MHTIGFVSLALGRVLVTAVAAHVAFHGPNIDIAKLCSGASVFGPRDKAVGICLRDERQARERLQALWPMLQESDRTLCLGSAELGVAGDYVDIVGCIDMNRELRRENSLPRDRSLPPQ